MSLLELDSIKFRSNSSSTLFSPARYCTSSAQLGYCTSSTRLGSFTGPRDGFVCLLVDGWSVPKCYGVENGSSIPRGVYDWKEMVDVLRTLGNHWRSSQPFSSLLFSLGRLLGLLH